jgi:very-short-patch-repair endonuclease
MERRYRSGHEQWRLLKPAARQMRKVATPAEDALWEALRGGRLEGIKFRRQHAIGRHIVDFFAAAHRLAVEVDGPIHDHQTDQDAARDAFLRTQGVRILRVKNEDVIGRLPWVLAEIVNLCTRTEPETE